jgi:transcriptional regulator with XRE-family HTH domain
MPLLVSPFRKSLEVDCVPYDADMHPGGRPAKHPRSGFGARLAKFREEAGLSQAELAEKIGITQQAIAHAERKASAVRSDTIGRIATALNVTVEELLADGAGANRKAASAAPVGRARAAFDKVSRLPRRQQDKIIEVVEALVAQHAKAV